MHWHGLIFSYVISLYDTAINIADKVFASLTYVLFYLGSAPITPLSIITFSSILTIFFWISRLTRIAIQNISGGKEGVHKAMLYRIDRLIHYSILITGTLFGLTFIGFDISHLILIAGALGVGIGFGLQSIFNNFFSGIIILIESSFNIGDEIEIDDRFKGKVKEINFRNTRIQTDDGLSFFIPNSELINQKVANWTSNDAHCVRVPFSLPLEIDKDLVGQIIEEAAKKIPATIQKKEIPGPRVYIKEIAHDKIQFELCVWIDSKSTKKISSASSLYLYSIHEALMKNGIYKYRNSDIKKLKSQLQNSFTC